MLVKRRLLDTGMEWMVCSVEALRLTLACMDASQPSWPVAGLQGCYHLSSAHGTCQHSQHLPILGLRTHRNSKQAFFAHLCKQLAIMNQIRAL